ncbi:MAG TPA: hypothetical protein VNK82_11715 [Terriglobales bacterium]|nr:hypothetical protein [Terriglobales bacterium]
MLVRLAAVWLHITEGSRSIISPSVGEPDQAAAAAILHRDRLR